MPRKLALVVASALLLVLAEVGTVAAQQTGRLAGKVTRPDGTGLAGVSVRIDPLNQVTLTDTSGAFAFAAVPPGTYDLTFSLSDHTAKEAGVEVAAGATRTVDKKVDWDVSFAETITVTSVSRREERITEAPASVYVVSEQEIEREAASGQVPKLLEFTPGVDFTQSGLYDFNFNTRLQQLPQPAHPHLDRRPRSGGALPRLPGMGGHLVPHGRAGQRRAGARSRLRSLRRQRLQRRPQHGD